jgi:ABC-type transporter Mla MlaB component
VNYCVYFYESYEVKKAKEKGINLGISLTIDQISALKKKIEKDFKNNDILTLTSDQVQLIDLTGVQLLQHYIQKAQKIGKELHWKLTISNEQKIMLEKNGFSYLLETISK